MKKIIMFIFIFSMATIIIFSIPQLRILLDKDIIENSKVISKIYPPSSEEFRIQASPGSYEIKAGEILKFKGKISFEFELNEENYYYEPFKSSSGLKVFLTDETNKVIESYSEATSSMLQWKEPKSSIGSGFYSPGIESKKFVERIKVELDLSNEEFNIPIRKKYLKTILDFSGNEKTIIDPDYRFAITFRFQSEAKGKLANHKMIDDYKLFFSIRESADYLYFQQEENMGEDNVYSIKPSILYQFKLLDLFNRLMKGNKEVE